MKKKICAIALSAVMIGSAGTLAACSDGEKDEKQAYVSLDINPAIELIVDKNENVISVRGENEDGQVLLYGETGIKGEKLDKAIEKITDLAVEYGYLDEDNKVVDALVSSGDGKFAEKVLNKVNASVTTTAANLGINVTVDGEGAYSLLRKMDEVKKQFPNDKAVQEMSVEKFRLALSVSETGEISLEAAISMDDKELIKMLGEATQRVEEFATSAYTQAKMKAEAVYEQATEIAGYAVYTTYYIEKALTHPMTAYYGGVYQMYASAAKGFEVICDVAEFSASVSKYPLDEEQVEAVVTALGMESADALKNSSGEITVESIEAYADKLFKNSPASEALDKIKADLSEALSKVESAIGEKVDELTVKYKPQIESATATARKVLETVEIATSILPESIRNIIDTCTADLNEILSRIDAMIAGDTIGLDDLRAEADRLNEKAQEYADKIKADLTEDELKELEARRDAVISKMNEQKQILDKALEDAEAEAKEYLAGLKEARKNHGV